MFQQDRQSVKTWCRSLESDLWCCAPRCGARQVWRGVVGFDGVYLVVCYSSELEVSNNSAACEEATCMYI